MKITIIGSVSASDKLIELAQQLETSRHQVFLPYLTERIRNGETTLDEYNKKRSEDGGDIKLRESAKVDFFKRYYGLIKDSDCVLVVNTDKNGTAGYIGGNALIDMAFAYVLDKPIYLLNGIPEVGYKDEIIDLKPVILNGDLSKIK